MLPRHVIFVDPPAFCTTLEELVAPALRARPIVVAAPGADRATVLALSPEARLAGITRGMPVAKARKRCPDLVLRPPNPALYARASKALHEILARYAPVIEPQGYGHAWLDVTGTGRLFGPPVDLAARILRESRERLRIPLAVGVAQNKLVSHAASEVVKEAEHWDARRAELLLDVPGGTEAPFLAPERVTLLPELDAAMRERLDDYQLDWIGELQQVGGEALAQVFGPPGRLLGQHALGIDARPVLPPAVKAEFRVTHTFGDDTNDLALLHRLLRHQAERLGARLRARQLHARRLTVRLAYADYATQQRSVPLVPSALDAELLEAARRAFTLANTRTVALRAVGMTVDRLGEDARQLDLWSDGLAGAPAGELAMAAGLAVAPDPGATPTRRRGAELQSALDRIRTRWGARGIRAGA